MYRRLHFLLPNALLAKNIEDELVQSGIDQSHIHTYAEHQQNLQGLNPATANQIADKAALYEKIIWNGNLFLFFTMAAVLLIAMLKGLLMLALFSLLLMIISFTLGNFFATYIPHIHLKQFKNALSHNEMLMMVDVPDDIAAAVEDRVHRNHPAAIEGGSSWTLKSIDI